MARDAFFFSFDCLRLFLLCVCARMCAFYFSLYKLYRIRLYGVSAYWILVTPTLLSLSSLKKLCTTASFSKENKHSDDTIEIALDFLFCFVLRSTFTQFYSFGFIWRWASTVWNGSGFHVSALRRRQRLLKIPAQNPVYNNRSPYTVHLRFSIRSRLLEYMNQMSRRWNGETFDSVSTVIIIIIIIIAIWQKHPQQEFQTPKMREEIFTLQYILCNLLSNVAIIE